MIRGEQVSAKIINKIALDKMRLELVTCSLSMITLLAACLYASSHQEDVNSFAGSCPTPVLSNFKLALIGSDIPWEFFPSPSPKK